MKIKAFIFFLLFFAGMETANSQCTWWAKSYGSSSTDVLNELATDGSGNIYATGSFSGTMNMGSFTLTSAGDEDIFLAKISESGTVIWAKSAGGLYADAGNAISLDASGNIYIGGSFYTSATFESTTINSGGGSKAFLAKFDNNGNLTWVHECLGYQVNSIANFGTKVYYVWSGESLVEYTNAGIAADTMQISNYYVNSEKIRVDQSGNIIIGGEFSSPADFGNGTKTPVGSDDIFIVKYTPSKVFSWVQTGGGSNDDYFHDLEIDNLGNPVIACSFSGSINFNGSIINSSTGSGSGQVLVKFSASGSQSWVKLSGDGYNSCCDEYWTSIALDAGNNIFHYTNKYYSTTIFNGITLSGLGSAVLAKYDGSGNILNAVMLGSSSYNSKKSISINSNSKIIMGDNYSYNVTFGSKKLTSVSNSTDFNIVKVDQFSDLVFQAPAICVVEIDASTHNKVVWNTAGMANVNFFTIYRENKVGGMDSIGAVNFGSGSSFIDLNSDPVERAYLYSLALTDVCGTEYEATQKHKTMHLQMYAGPANRWSLSWTEYEGLNAEYYRIYRGITSTTMVPYDSIAADFNTYTDVNAPTGDVYYKIVAVVNNLSCGNMPSSNRIASTDIGFLGITKPQDANWFSLYPNPAAESITIEIPAGNADFKIIDLLGRVLEQGNVALLRSVDLTNFSKGMYRIFLETESGTKGSKSFVVR
jgi:hypothetical protein